jgi:hypothetical protein
MKRLVRAAIAAAAISTAPVPDGAGASAAQKPKVDGHGAVVTTMPGWRSGPFSLSNASVFPVSRDVSNRRIDTPAARVSAFTMHPTPLEATCDVGDNEHTC